MRKNTIMYHCEKCDKNFYVSTKTNFCPICGSREVYLGSKKLQMTAKRHIDKLNTEIIPKLNALCKELSDVYSEYMKLHETVRSYSYRGLIKKESVPEFKLPSLTKAFYQSRKSNKKEDAVQDEELNKNADYIDPRIDDGGWMW